MSVYEDGFKISVRSSAEIRERLAVLIARHANTACFGGAKLSRELLLNALIAHLDSLDRPAQARLIGQALDSLQALTSGTEPVLTPSPVPASKASHLKSRSK